MMQLEMKMIRRSSLRKEINDLQDFSCVEPTINFEMSKIALVILNAKRSK